MAFERRDGKTGTSARSVQGALSVRGVDIELARKDIRTVRITVLPPDGRVRVSVPFRADERTIRDLVVERIDWIRKKREEVRARSPRADLSYVTGEELPLWGVRYALVVEETRGRGGVSVADGTLALRTKPASTREAREKAVYAWYRALLLEAVPQLVDTWSPRVGKRPSSITFRRMKTKWGSCEVRSGRVCLNVELAKYPPECLEYVLVHEMTHLLEASHDARFKKLLADFLPRWKETRDLLNGKSRAPRAPRAPRENRV